ncbi:MAG: PAQR family membrane homeostasis protein TrhA [Pseudooceanicola sp.]
MLLDHGFRPAYSRAERISDGVIHVAGVSFAAIAAPVLLAMTILYHDDSRVIWGTGIYGATLIAMLTFSALYNMIDSDRWRGILRRLDHSGIYFKIAGTYTPFVLVAGAHPATLLAGLWGTAAFGSVMKFLAPHRFKWLAIALYLAMGWAIFVADRPLLTLLTPPVPGLMLAGGIAYTLGVVFFLFERLPFHYTIWHVFVLTGSVLFYAAVAMQAFAPAA